MPAGQMLAADRLGMVQVTAPTAKTVHAAGPAGANPPATVVGALLMAARRRRLNRTGDLGRDHEAVAPSGADRL